MLLHGFLLEDENWGEIAQKNNFVDVFLLHKNSNLVAAGC